MLVSSFVRKGRGIRKPTFLSLSLRRWAVTHPLLRKGRRPMTASPLKELYTSPNGDRWVLSRDGSGRLFVTHFPNAASGGRPSEVSVQAFLSQGGQGPEHQALAQALASLCMPPGVAPEHDGHRLAADKADDLYRALGRAVTRCWSSLPPGIQHNLFEAAVAAEGETIRQQLAVYLHDHHARTINAVQSQAMFEPDSLGG
jgi:hypothetical protein